MQATGTLSLQDHNTWFDIQEHNIQQVRAGTSAKGATAEHLGSERQVCIQASTWKVKVAPANSGLCERTRQAIERSYPESPPPPQPDQSTLLLA